MCEREAFYQPQKNFSLIVHTWKPSVNLIQGVLFDILHLIIKACQEKSSRLRLYHDGEVIY